MKDLNSKIEQALLEAEHLEILEHYNSLFKREQRKCKVINLANLALKVVASLTLLFLFVRAYHIDHVLYTKLKPYEIVALNFYVQEIPNYRNVNAYNDSVISAIDMHLQKHNYLAAFNVASSVYKETNLDAWALTSAQCVMQTGKYKKALCYLNNIEHGSPFYATANYYRLGCFLANGQIEKAKEIAVALKESPFYQKKIAELNKNIGVEL